MENEKDISLLESYILKTADKQSSEEIRNRLEQDKEFKALYHELVEIRHGVKLSALSDKKKMLEVYDQQLAYTSIPKAGQNNVIGKRKWMALAASILLLAMAGLWFANQNSSLKGEDIFVETFEPIRQNVKVNHRGVRLDPENPTLSEEEKTIAYKTEKAYLFYNAEAYDKALPYFDELILLDNSEVHLFYRSISQLMTGDLIEARKGLYRNYGDEIDNSDLIYIRGMLELRENKIEEAKKLLETLPKNYKPKALEALGN